MNSTDSARLRGKVALVTGASRGIGRALALSRSLRKGPESGSSLAGAKSWIVAPLALFLATLPRRGPTGQSFSLARREL